MGSQPPEAGRTRCSFGEIEYISVSGDEDRRARGLAALEHHVVPWITTEGHRSRRNHDARVRHERRHAADERLALLRGHLACRAQSSRNLAVLGQEISGDVEVGRAQDDLQRLRWESSEGVGGDENARVNDDSESCSGASRVASSAPSGRLPRRPSSSTSSRGTPHARLAAPHRVDLPATARRGCTPPGRSSVPKPSWLPRIRSDPSTSTTAFAVHAARGARPIPTLPAAPSRPSSATGPFRVTVVLGGAPEGAAGQSHSTRSRRATARSTGAEPRSAASSRRGNGAAGAGVAHPPRHGSRPRETAVSLASRG